jgi:hypothetical protein
MVPTLKAIAIAQIVDGSSHAELQQMAIAVDLAEALEHHIRSVPVAPSTLQKPTRIGVWNLGRTLITDTDIQHAKKMLAPRMVKRLILVGDAGADTVTVFNNHEYGSTDFQPVLRLLQAPDWMWHHAINDRNSLDALTSNTVLRRNWNTQKFTVQAGAWGSLQIRKEELIERRVETTSKIIQCFPEQHLGFSTIINKVKRMDQTIAAVFHANRITIFNHDVDTILACFEIVNEEAAMFLPFSAYSIDNAQEILKFLEFCNHFHLNITA